MRVQPNTALPPSTGQPLSPEHGGIAATTVPISESRAGGSTTPLSAAQIEALQKSLQIEEPKITPELKIISLDNVCAELSKIITQIDYDTGDDIWQSAIDSFEAKYRIVDSSGDSITLDKLFTQTPELLVDIFLDVCTSQRWIPKSGGLESFFLEDRTGVGQPYQPLIDVDGFSLLEMSSRKSEALLQKFSHSDLTEATRKQLHQFFLGPDKSQKTLEALAPDLKAAMDQDIDKVIESLGAKPNPTAFLLDHTDPKQSIDAKKSAEIWGKLIDAGILIQMSESVVIVNPALERNWASKLGFTAAQRHKVESVIHRMQGETQQFPQTQYQDDEILQVIVRHKIALLNRQGGLKTDRFFGQIKSDCIHEFCQQFVTRALQKGVPSTVCFEAIERLSEEPRFSKAITSAQSTHQFLADMSVFLSENCAVDQKKDLVLYLSNGKYDACLERVLETPFLLDTSLSDNQDTPLHKAAESGMTRTLAILLNKTKDDRFILQKDKFGKTFFDILVENRGSSTDVGRVLDDLGRLGKTDVIPQLILGDNIETSPLAFAINHGLESTASHLLENIDITPDLAHTLLKMAAITGRDEILEKVLHAARNAIGETELIKVLTGNVSGEFRTPIAGIAADRGMSYTLNIILAELDTRSDNPSIEASCRENISQIATMLCRQISANPEQAMTLATVNSLQVLTSVLGSFGQEQVSQLFLGNDLEQSPIAGIIRNNGREALSEILRHVRLSERGYYHLLKVAIEHNSDSSLRVLLESIRQTPSLNLANILNGNPHQIGRAHV